VNWQIVITADGTVCTYLVPGDTRKEAVAYAKRKARRDLHGQDLRIRSAERITI
jgi:hypothetical protein